MGHSRLLQICSGDLQPFIVILIDDIKLLCETSRGSGGYAGTYGINKGFLKSPKKGKIPVK